MELHEDSKASECAHVDVVGAAWCALLKWGTHHAAGPALCF